MRLTFVMILALSGTAVLAESPGGISLDATLWKSENAVLRDASSRVTFRFDDSISGIVDVGVTSDGIRETYFAAAGIALPFGEVEVGRPRSILEDGPLPAWRLPGSSGLVPSRSLATEAALDDRLGAGIRLSGAAGRLHLGSSLHEAGSGEDPILGIAGRYDLGPFDKVDRVAFYGGAEADGADQRFRLGTEIARGATTASLDLVRRDGDEGYLLGRVNFDFEVTDRLTIGLSGLHEIPEEESEDAETRIGLGASLTGAGGNAVLRGSVDGVTSDDPALDISIGFQF